MIKKKHFLATLLAAVALSTSAVQAGDCYSSCNPCDTDSCFGGFEIGADFLYWKMCMDDLDYAVSYTSTFDADLTSAFNQIGCYDTVSTDWKPGFRVYLAKENIMCDWGLLLSYTWMRNFSTDSDNIESLTDGVVLIQPTVGILNIGLSPTGDADLGIFGVTTIDAEYDITYQTFDVLFASDYCFRQCHSFKPYFGVTGLFLDQSFTTAWTMDAVPSSVAPLPASIGGTRWSDDFSGYGFKFGGEYSFDICDGLSMFANGSGAITVGTHTANFSQTRTTIGLTSVIDDVTNTATLCDEECTLVSGYHIQVGFQYASCACDIEYALRIGYEFLEWRNVPNQRRFFSSDFENIANSSSPTTSTLGFHGLLAGLTFSF